MQQPDQPSYEYSKAEIRSLLQSSLSSIKNRTISASENAINEQIYSFAGSIIEQARKVIDAAESNPDVYEGPEKQEMQKIVDGGIEGLADTLGDFSLFAWSPYLRVVIKSQPSIRLDSPKIDLNGIKLEVTATGLRA
jgi:hypothetical protein